jgi:hypothetical protein
MREDMSKVLVERPRAGHRSGEMTSRHARRTYNQNLRHVGDEDNYRFDAGGNTESISAKTRHPKRSPKEFNENLNPLRRFLRSRLGQPWDKVYSEIMAGLNMKNTAQYHVWQHLISLGEVETKTYMEGNTIMIAGSSPREVGDWYTEEFYVHPKTGVLCSSPSRRPSWFFDRNKKMTQTQLSYIDSKKPLTQYHQINNIWYEIQFRRPTDDEMKKKQFGCYVRRYNLVTSKIEYRWELLQSPIANDLAEGRLYRNEIEYGANLWNCCYKMFGGNYLPLRKRQIGSREIRRIESLLSEKKKAA